MKSKQRIAIVGSGISGLSAAWLLGRTYDVTLFEAGSYLGGHTNTVDVMVDGKTHPVDTGFLVFNRQCYQNLIAMFALLGINSVETEMSFSVSLENPDLEWSGKSLLTVFGQKRNLFSREFWSMLSDVLRFNRESIAWLASHPENRITLRKFLIDGEYSEAFTDWYLLPMAAAIWSSPTGQILDMPLSTFVRFCQNHCLLQVADRPMWHTVKGGGREYVKKIAAQLDDVRLNCPVTGVTREADGLHVAYQGGSEVYDQVVMACHSDQSLRILGMTASEGQRDVLSAVRYQTNRALLHTDTRLLPRNPKLWSAWNYFAGNGKPGTQPVGVSYLINKLQPLPFETPVMVTLNPAREPDAGKVLAEFEYDHPIFDSAAIAAQRRLSGVQGENGIWLAGAWGGYGFHEDGLVSALGVCNGLGVRAPWQGEIETVPRLMEPA